MTNPIHDEPSDPKSWRLILDESETLEVTLAPPPGSAPTQRPDVVVSMSASRAADLSRVLATYSRIAAILQESSEVSSTEDSLARALRDAASAATGPVGSPAERIKVSDGARLTAMDMLQKTRPELTHSMLVAIIDATVWWLDDDMDDNAMDLLTAVSDEIGMSTYLTLLGRSVPSGSAANAT